MLTGDHVLPRITPNISPSPGVTDDVLGEVIDVIRAEPGANTLTVAAGLHWSRPWSQMQGMPRRFAVGEACAHLLHLEQTGRIVNKGEDIDSWQLASAKD